MQNSKIRRVNEICLLKVKTNFWNIQELVKTYKFKRLKKPFARASPFDFDL